MERGTPALVATLLALAATVPTIALAGSRVWTSGGPYGGSARVVAIDSANPSTMYAGTQAGGLFKSTDSGAFWTRSETGQGNPYVLSLGIDPVVPTRLYAGLGDGLVRSSDGGASWTLTAVPAVPVRGLAVDPLSPVIVYAGTGLVGVLKSTDAGDTWAAANTGLTALDVHSLVLDPSSHATLYAGTGQGRIFKTTDAGSQWAPLYAGSSPISTIAVDPVLPSRLYAGSLASDGGVLKSTDSGNTWAPANAGLTALDVATLAIDPAAVETLYAGTISGGVFKSTDCGGSWSRASTDRGSPSVFGLAIHPVAHATLYAATLAGITRSTDAGLTWRSTVTGLVNLNVNALAVDPLDRAVVYAGATSFDSGYFAQPGGVFKSTDSGATWAAASAGLTFPYVMALAVNPSNPSELYAGTTSALFTSTDAGATWAVPPSLGLGAFVVAVAFDPTAPATRYCVSSVVMKSTDAGGTWNPAHTGLAGTTPRALAIDPAASSTLYLGTDGLYGVYKSTNGGDSWLPADTGLRNRHITALAIDPTAPATLYAGSQLGVDKTTDAGASWSAAGTGLTNRMVYAIAVDATAPATVYAATSTRGAFDGRPGGAVYKSTDGGGTWAPLRAGLPPTPSVYSLALDAPGGTTLYAGLQGGGVWQAAPPPPMFVKGDLDGDGRADLVFRSNLDGAQNKTWLMNGVARLGEAPLSPDAASADWALRGVDDFDANGSNDLVFRNQATAAVQFWLMNGTTRVGAPLPLGGAAAPGTDWELAATADFDRDGQADLVWRNLSSQKLAIWRMSGTRKAETVVPSPDQAVDGNWRVVAATDFNDDGRVDFLWYNVSSGKVVTWYMDGSVARLSGQFTNPSSAGHANWRVVAASDFSLDGLPGTPPLGSPDLVWRNETSGSQVAWHMDFASTRVFGQFTSPAANTPPLDWTIVGPR